MNSTAAATADPTPSVGLSAPLGRVWSAGDWARVGTRARTQRVMPFVVLCLCSLAVAAAVPHDTDLGLLGLAATLQISTGLLLVMIPWHRVHAAWVHVPVITFCASVVLLREATGGSATGYGTALVLLPVIWQSVYGRRIDLAVALATVAGALTLPLVAFDGYPVRIEAPRIALMLMVAAATGTLLQSLIEAVKANDDALRRLVRVSRDLHSSTRPREGLCDAVQSLLDADRVELVLERDGTLRGSGVAGDVLAPAGARALLSGEIQTEESGRGSLRQPHRGSPSRIHIPIGAPGATRGVVTATWDHHRPALRRAMIAGLALLGADAALALDRADLIAQLEHQARRDDTTGLLNRRSWDEIVDRELAITERTGRPLSLAIVDLDHFKGYNDRHGHLAGDELLREAGVAWSAGLRTGEVLARWGGEEFALLFPGSDSEAALAAVERLRARTPGGQTFSAGVSQYRPGDTAGMLVAAADAAMYQAKVAGRDQIVRAAPFPGVGVRTGPPAHA